MSKPPLPKSKSKPIPAPIQENHEEEHDQNLKNMTLLSPEAIQWMNKRRPLKPSQVQPQHISPHRASQLRDMFDGLDFNGGGEIDLKEFKEAIAYVESRTSGTSIFGDPKRVNEIFQEMDADGSGTVDFNEFVTALTSDSKSGTNSGNQLSQLQHTFYEFANMHRRQNILDKIEHGNDDLQRYNEFEKLFKVEYFVEGDEEVSLEEKLSKAERDAIFEKKRLKKFYETRNTEITRARTAQILFQTERETQSRILAKSSGSEGFVDINKLAESYQRREKFSKRMGAFGLKKQSTRIPSINSTLNDRKTQLEVIQDLSKDRRSCTILPPPVSVRTTWEMKGKEFRDAKLDRESARSNE